MGFLDSITTALNSQGQQPGQAGNPTSALVSEVLTVIESQHGGIGGLLQSFQQNGIGHLIQSWIGTGQNLPISADQIRNALGPACTARIAQATGIPQAEVEGHLTSVLPQLIDHLTPNGQMPQGDLKGVLANVAQRFLRGGN
ncbi:MAG TPA: YidB family protein [Steroidobacteraceae bacterium]|jgi:uncharacterized protein YidB (DUF937 family)